MMHTDCLKTSCDVRHLSLKSGRGRQIAEDRCKLRSFSNHKQNDVAYIESDAEYDKDALLIKVQVERCEVEMEVDSGSKYSIISHLYWRKYFPHLRLQPFDVNLIVLTGQNVNVIGCLMVSVHKKCVNKNESQFDLKLLVIKTQQQKDFMPLIGRTWLNVLFEDWRSVFIETKHLATASDRSKLIKECIIDYLDVFRPCPRSFVKNFSITVHLDENILLSPAKPKPIPFGLQNRVDFELDRLIRCKVLSRSSSADFAWPMAILKKSSDTLEIVPSMAGYGNIFKLTDYDPSISNRENILADLIGCRCFCKLQLNDIYSQICISKECQRFFTISTESRGNFCYTRLPFGSNIVSKSVEVLLHSVLKNMKQIGVYKTLVVVGGFDLSDCKDNLCLVLQHFAQHHIKINLKRCELFRSKINFYGYVLSGDGILPQIEKISLQHCTMWSNLKAVQVAEVRSTIDSLWNSKKWLCDPNAFSHYDPEQVVCVVCTSSSIAIAGTLFHLYEANEPKPLKFFASKLPNSSSCYSKLELEVLAVVETIRKFYEYLDGQKFIIFTDQHQLEQILNPNTLSDRCRTASPSKCIQIKNLRLLQWRLYLNQFDYEVLYERTPMIVYSYLFCQYPELLPNTTGRNKAKSMKDAGSEISSDQQDEETNQFSAAELFQGFPLQLQDLRSETQSDLLLTKIKNCILHHHNATASTNIDHSNRFSNDYSIDIDHDYDDDDANVVPMQFSLHNGCIMHGHRLCIPDSLRLASLKYLHSDHTNAAADMHRIAKMCVWWLDIKYDIEMFVKNCSYCCEANE